MSAMVEIFSWGERWNVLFNEAKPSWIEHFIFHRMKIFVPLHELKNIHYLFYITFKKILVIWQSSDKKSWKLLTIFCKSKGIKTPVCKQLIHVDIQSNKKTVHSVKSQKFSNFSNSKIETVQTSSKQKQSKLNFKVQNIQQKVCV